MLPRLLFLLALAILPVMGWGQTTFFTESFETTSGYTFPNGNGGSGQDFFDRTDLAGAPSQEVFTYSGFDGTYFIAGEDIDGTLSGSVGQVLISGINISGRSSLELTASFASGTDIDIDDPDAIWVEVRIDGGSWSEIGRFEADPGTYTGCTGNTCNGQFAEDTDGDGDGDGTLLNGNFTDFTWSISGTGSTLDIRISIDLDAGDEEGAFDNVRVAGISATPPDITLSDNGTQVAAGNVNQGAVDHILSQTQAAVTVADATLNSFEFTTGGTYAPTDLVNFKLRYSTDATLDGGDATLATETIIPATGGTVTFGSLSQLITDGSTGYFFITADINAAATAGNTVSAGVPTYTFAAGTPTGTMTAGGDQTISAVTPDVALSSPNPAVAAATLDQGTTDNPIYRFDLAVTTANAEVTAVDISTSAGIEEGENLKLWYSTDATFDGGDTPLGSTIATPAAGPATESFSGFNQTITAGNTGYFFVTIDVPCDATDGSTFNINAITTGGDITYAATVNETGTASAGGTQTLNEITPNEVTGLAVAAGNTDAEVSWTNPTGCFEEVIIVVHTSSISGTPSGTYTANSLSYTDPGNPSFPGGGVVVYNGSASPQTVTDLTNGTQYFFKVFARNGAEWSSGEEVDGTPVNLVAPIAGTVFITEVVDAASDFNAEYMEIFNNSPNTVDLSNSKLVRVDASSNASEYVFDFGTDESTSDVDATIPPFGFIIVARGATKTEFETEWGALASGISYNGGNSNNFFGTGRRWRLRDGGTANTDDGTLIDDTDGGVGSSRDIQNIFTEIFSTVGNSNDANPGELDYLLYNGGSWVNGNAIGSGTGTEDVLVYDNLSIASDASSNDLSVSSGGSVIVASSATLTINGDYTNNGTVTVEDGSSVLMDAATTISGDMTVQRVGTPFSNIYNYWSSPVSGVQYDQIWDFGTGNTQFNSGDLYRYNAGTQQWSTLSSTASVTAGMGFAMTGPINDNNNTNTISYTGAPNNGDVSVALTDNGTDAWNLVGNPYPSAITVSQFLTDNAGGGSPDIAGTLYFWDLNLTTIADTGTSADYATRTSSAGTAARYASEVPDTFIASGQGFFVEALTTNTVTDFFNNGQRVAGGNTQFFKTGDDYERIWIEAYTNDRKDWNHIAIVFGDDCTDGFDNLHDGKKLKGNPNIAFYSKLNGEDYAIQALAPLNGQSKSVPLGLDAGTAGNYTIAIDSIDGIAPSIGIFLHNVTSGQYHDLRRSEYTFSVNTDNSTLTQYELVFSATLTGIEAMGEKSWFYAFTQGGTLLVRSHSTLPMQQVSLTDLQGRIVRQSVTNGPEVRIATTGLASGLYVLVATSTQGQQAQKVFIP